MNMRKIAEPKQHKQEASRTVILPPLFSHSLPVYMISTIFK